MMGVAFCQCRPGAGQPAPPGRSGWRLGRSRAGLVRVKRRVRVAVICTGSGAPGDWFEHGHFIIAGTEQGMFPIQDRSKTFGRTYSRKRCHLCASTRRYWLRSKDATSKATKSHRSHAHKMVRFGLAPDVESAVAIMNATGLTVPFLAQSALDAIGKPCPGRCFVPAIVNGKPECHEHIIAEWNDLWLDWKDPRYPLSPENVGWLCPTCNKQKQKMPWAQFMARQHAIRQNFLHGERLGWQASLFDDEEGVA